MGHHITGLIARRDVLERIGDPFAGQPYFSLALGMAFMPLDRQNLDGIAGLHQEKAVGDFFHLTGRLIELLCLASRSGALAYVETEYFGGAGAQGAVVFRGGEVMGQPDWRKSGAINDALAKIGVTHGADAIDAFAAVGLDAFRCNAGLRETGTIA